MKQKKGKGLQNDHKKDEETQVKCNRANNMTVLSIQIRAYLIKRLIEIDLPAFDKEMKQA